MLMESLSPLFRKVIRKKLSQKLGHLRPNEKESLRTALKAVDEEEARATCLYAIGKITEVIWDQLWAEWQDRRRTLLFNLDVMEQKHDYYIANLDAALKIIAKVGILYKKLERGEQKDLLRQMIERVVVNPEGQIKRLELLLPFAYLRKVTKRVKKGGGKTVKGKTKTSAAAGSCSDWVSGGGPEGQSSVN
jgi:hypothetical protein